MPHTKQELRKQFLAKRKLLTQEEADSDSTQIFQNLFHHALLSQKKEKQNIALYFPIRNEVNTQLIFNKILTQEGFFYLPKINDYTKPEMSFYKVEDIKDLEVNSLNIAEPKTTLPPIFPNLLDIVLVPLVAFDKAGYRLGMGKGYYDHYFSFLGKQAKTERIKPLLIGLAYEFQYYPGYFVEKDPWDISLDYVVTEKSCYSFRFN